MDVRKFGYIRLRSIDQIEGRQLQAMLENGLNERDIFLDKQSGKNFNQEQYLLKRMIRKGDVLYIHSLDRFGRNKERFFKNGMTLLKIFKQIL